MRILQIVHNYPPEFRGGVERYVEQLTASLSGLGQSVAVLCGSEQTSPEVSVNVERWQGVPVYRLTRPSGFRSPIDPFDPDVVQPFEDVLDDVRPQVIHLHHWWNLGDDLVRRATARGYPVVVTLHDAFTTCSLFFRLPDESIPCVLHQTADGCAPCIGTRFGGDEREVRDMVTQRETSFRAELVAAVRILTPSAAHSALLSPVLPGRLRMRTLPLGSRSFGAPLPTLPATDGAQLRILHFGNLSRLKGVELLARAVEEADPGGGHITLTLAGGVVGEGLDLGRARCTGPYDREELMRLAQDADVAVFPSLAPESYGLVVDEALRMGLPVVVSDRGALRERIGERGVVIPAGDQGALARMLIDFLEDPERLLALRRGAEPTLLTPDEHASALLEIYAAALKVPLKAVDLETPLLSRISRARQRMGEVIEILQRGSRSDQRP